MRMVVLISPIKISRTVFGATMSCDGRDFVQRRIRFFQVFEHNLTYYTLEHLREGDLYVDIGANVGYYSLLASRCVGKTGKVIAVEADPVTFTALTRNLELNGSRNVLARNIAATAISCRVTIQHPDSGNSGTNTIKIGSDAGGVDVEGLPFRDIVGEDLRRVRFIKIDIEGSEEPVLSAILDALSELPDDLIVASEVSPASADHVAGFVAAGFRAYAVQNSYDIDYYLLRSYLRRFGEDKAAHMVPVRQYDHSCSDYVFERAGVPDAQPHALNS